jgi:hypothetical protein
MRSNGTIKKVKRQFLELIFNVDAFTDIHSIIAIFLIDSYLINKRLPIILNYGEIRTIL